MTVTLSRIERDSQPAYRSLAWPLFILVALNWATVLISGGQWSMQSQNVSSIYSSDSTIGYITSPNYPQSTADEVMAAATLHVYDKTSDTIKLSFEDFHLQTANNCEGEVLNIFVIEPNDYALDPQKLVYSFCGSKHIEPVVIYERNLVIQYMKDEFTSVQPASRFRIKFEFLNSQQQLYNGCEKPNQFKCLNRKCISIQLICNKFDDCGDGSDEDRWTPCHETPTIPYKINYKCGLSSFGNSLADTKLDRSSNRARPELKLRNRIVGGKQASLESRQLPQVSIQLAAIEPISHSCGGTLIHPMFVLTSAHCFKNELAARNYKLIFGAHDISNMDDATIQVRYISHISFYPSFIHILPESYYNNEDRANNLALIELNAPVVLTPHVWPACLPHLGETIEDDRECLVTGYGETRGSGSTLSLKQVKQVIRHGSKCKSSYRDFKIDDYTMICVENESANGPCHGDSGGPLLCRDDDGELGFRPVNISEAELLRKNELTLGEPGDIIRFLKLDSSSQYQTSMKSYDGWQKSQKESRYTVYGVISFTTDGNSGGGYCGLRGAPTIYGRVSTRVEWILSVMKLALPRLSKDDSTQDRINRVKFFGYMFRTGYSQHKNFTRPMTISNNSNNKYIY